MSGSFFSGQSNGRYVEGLSTGLPSEVKDLAVVGATSLGQMGAAVIKKFTGVSVEPEVVERVAREAMSGKDENTA